MTELSPAQAAQQDNRNGAGRYAEKDQADPGQTVLKPWEPKPEPSAELQLLTHNAITQHEITKATQASIAWARQRDKLQAKLTHATDEWRTAEMAGICSRVAADHPTARWIRAVDESAPYGSKLTLTGVYEDDMTRLGEVPGGSLQFDHSLGSHRAIWRKAYDHSTRRIDVVKMRDLFAKFSAAPTKEQ